MVVSGFWRGAPPPTDGRGKELLRAWSYISIPPYFLQNVFIYFYIGSIYHLLYMNFMLSKTLYQIWFMRPAIFVWNTFQFDEYLLKLRCDSSVSIVTRLWLDNWWTKVQFPAGVEIFFFFAVSRLALAPTQPPFSRGKVAVTWSWQHTSI
jgi:hypothetical protein